MTGLRLRGSGEHLRIDKSDAPLQIHDYRGHVFTANNLPQSLAGFVLDRIALDSLLKLAGQGHEISFRKAVFYQTDFSNLTITGLDFAHAKFTQCRFYRSEFINCNLKWATVSSDCTGVMLKNCSVSYANFTGARNLSGEQIIHNKGVMEAKFIDVERLVKEAHKQEKHKSSRSVLRNLFGDNERDYLAPKQTSAMKPASTRSFVERVAPKREGLSEQAQAANRLFASFAEQGKSNFRDRIDKKRTAARKELLGR